MARTIFGTVRDQSTGVPIADVKVVAWDKDSDAHDFMGEAMTGHDGKYSIAYPKKDHQGFDWDPLKKEPDIYVVIWEKDVLGRWQKRGQSRVYDSHNPSIDLQIDFAMNPAPYQNMVYGSVYHADHTPASNAHVVAWDDDYPFKATDDILGDVATDASGNYIIPIPANALLDSDRPDIYATVRHIVGGNPQIVRSPTYLDIATDKGVRIDLIIPK